MISHMSNELIGKLFDSFKVIVILLNDIIINKY